MLTKGVTFSHQFVADLRLENVQVLGVVHGPSLGRRVNEARARRRRASVINDDAGRWALRDGRVLVGAVVIVQQRRRVDERQLLPRV